MRKVTAVVVVLALTVSCSATWAVNITTNNEMHQQNSEITVGSMTKFLSCSMFDGIDLTERQRMRDLMQQTRYDRAPFSAGDLEALHNLTRAEQFDETAYRTRLEMITRKQVDRQLEFARVRNQIYHLLTPQQQAVAEQNY